MSVSFRHLEIDVLGLDILVGDVLRDDLVGDVSARRYEIPSRPKMSAPERTIQRPKVAHQPHRTLALDRIHDAARRERRRNTQQKVHMVRADVPLRDLDVQRLANLSDQLP